MDEVAVEVKTGNGDKVDPEASKVMDENNTESSEGSLKDDDQEQSTRHNGSLKNQNDNIEHSDINAHPETPLEQSTLADPLVEICVTTSTEDTSIDSLEEPMKVEGVSTEEEIISQIETANDSIKLFAENNTVVESSSALLPPEEEIVYENCVMEPVSLEVTCGGDENNMFGVVESGDGNTQTDVDIKSGEMVSDAALGPVETVQCMETDNINIVVVTENGDQSDIKVIESDSIVLEPLGSVVEISTENLDHNEECNTNNNYAGADKVVPLFTENILSALSEIHGEESSNVSSELPSVENSLYSDEASNNMVTAKINNTLKYKQLRVRDTVRRGRPVLNDKQLLAILQDGAEQARVHKTRILKTAIKISKQSIDERLEKQIALKQLREIPRKRKSKNFNEILVNRIEDVKIPKVSKKKTLTPTKDNGSEKLPTVQTSTPVRADISSIIDEWTEEETAPPLHNNQLDISDANTTADSAGNITITTSDASINTVNNNQEAFIKPRRIARIIKKKIIYDPDNPETFKFASNIVQAAIASEIQTKTLMENKSKAQVATNDNKLGKTEGKQNKLPNTATTSDVKTPKLNPAEVRQIRNIIENKTPTKSVTKKRLSEVDKLLMDEGAVNMLYQMEQGTNDGEQTLQVPNKKKKSMSISNEKKVKIIKKAVINHSKAKADQGMKVFRARREKAESNNAKVSAGSVGRASVQSPSLSEMSGVSVNESRIIRRHSSSSFSSGCLSPRPQSPSGEATNMSANTNSDPGSNNKIIKKRGPRQKKSSKVAEKNENLQSSSGEAPEVAPLQMKSFTQLTMDLSNSITHIIVSPTGNREELYDYQVITEVTAAIRLCATTNTSAVLLSSAQGTLCGGLDLRGLLRETNEQQRHHAEQLLDSLRELMVTLCECRFPLVCCVGGACTGLGVALLTLCDLAVASDRATFCVVPRPRRKLPPEGAALLTRPYGFPPQTSRELVLCGRKLTASEALQRGIISRTLWPDRFIEEVRSMTQDLGQHPIESFTINKNILRRGEVTAVTSALRHEGRLLLEYWCSPVGQAAIQETHAHLQG